MPILSWSHSRLATFETCKYRAFLLYEQKVQEPQRPLPAGKLEHANDRGTRIHDGCEKFVKGDVDFMPAEARKNFGGELERMRELYRHGIVSLEGEWGMNRNWEPWAWHGQWIEVPGFEANMPFAVVKELPKRAETDTVYKVGSKYFAWMAPWLRLKLDALVFENKHSAIAIDYKSGRKFGNELKHGEQLNLYQLVTFLRYPDLEEVTTELWYLDVDELTQKKFTREQGLKFMRNWDRRANALTTAADFPPNANLHTCKWCMLGDRPGGAGICKVGKW